MGGFTVCGGAPGTRKTSFATAALLNAGGCSRVFLSEEDQKLKRVRHLWTVTWWENGSGAAGKFSILHRVASSHFLWTVRCKNEQCAQRRWVSYSVEPRNLFSRFSIFKCGLGQCPFRKTEYSKRQSVSGQMRTIRP